MNALDHAIWWQVYPLGACGAPVHDYEVTHVDATTPVVHRLGLLENWLDYVVELGCSGLLLGPVFASTKHGYDTLDYFRLGPRLGDEGDWRHLVDVCHARGLLIMLDGVFNHVGVHHELVGRAMAGEGMIRLRDGRPAAWEASGDLAELDHDDPRVVDLVAEVMEFWLDRGADGWRLDVAYAVPGAFWTRVLDRVRRTHPDAMFLGEVLHGDFAAIADARTLDAVTAYELWKATWSSIHDQNLWELAWAMQRHDEFCQRTRMQTFVGNHDVTRIASQVGDAGAALAAVILMTVPGVPSVYYGDEQAFRGVKGTGFAADAQIRPPLPERPDELSPAGQWLYRLYQELIALRRRNSWLTDGRLEVIDKTNETIRYAVRGASHTLEASIDLVAPRAEVTVDGGPEFSWPQ